MGSAEVSRIIRSIRIEFLYDLYCMGVTLDTERLELLVRYDFITEVDEDNCNIDEVRKLLTSKGHKERKVPKKVSINRGVSNKDYRIKEEIERVADSYIDIENGIGEKEYEGMVDITVSDWIVKRASDGSWPEVFCSWIDSINRGFGGKYEYRPFNLYRQQAYSWISENGSINDLLHSDEQYDYARIEKQRCTMNSLYFLNKYHSLKEGEIQSGDRQFEAWHCQEVVCYLYD